MKHRYLRNRPNTGAGTSLCERLGVDPENVEAVGFGMPCDDCGEFFEAEAAPKFLDRWGFLCDGHRCANE